MVESPVKVALSKDFHTLEVDSKAGEVILRADLSTKSDVLQWVQKFENDTSHKWNVQRKNDNLDRYLLFYKYECHFSDMNKISASKKSTGCPVKMTIKIKKVNRNTIKNDKYLNCKKNEGIIRRAEIKIFGTHNHHKMCAESLKFNPLSDKLKKKLFDLFDENNTPAQAKRIIEEEIMCEDDYLVQLADGSKNPTSNSLYYQHSLWLKENFGSQSTDTLSKIKEKIDLGYYKSRGAKVTVEERDGEWAVCIATEIMERAHSLPSAGEVCFVDSSSHLDSTHCTLTSMSAASKAGALPLCILLHSHQTKSNYKMAFALFQKSFPNAFGGDPTPSIFMTDDSAAEKSALQEIWPLATQLLCIFHFLANQWKTILETCKKDDRPKLMDMVYKVVYAANEREFQAAVTSILAKKKKYPSLVRKFDGLIKRSHEWALHERMELLTRDNHTNNYSEASIRIIKEVVMERLRAFNPCALLEFLIGPLESYYKRRLLDHAHSRNAHHNLLFDRLLSRLDNVNPDTIKQIGPNLYEVPSSKLDGTTYEIHCLTGVCTCPMGESGAFCKHQALVLKTFKISLPSSPPLLSCDRHALAKIATGNDCLPLSFFAARTEEVNDEHNSVSQIDADRILSGDEANCDDVDGFVQDETQQIAGDSSPHNIESLKRAFSEMLDRCNEGDLSPMLIKKAVFATKRATTSAAVAATVVKFYRAASSTTRPRSRIPVQITGVQRRREGVARSSRQIPRGRPSIAELRLRNAKKKPRNLSQAVRNNTANAKSH